MSASYGYTTYGNNQDNVVHALPMSTNYPSNDFPRDTTSVNNGNYGRPAYNPPTPTGSSYASAPPTHQHRQQQQQQQPQQMRQPRLLPPPNRAALKQERKAIAVAGGLAGAAAGLLVLGPVGGVIGGVGGAVLAKKGHKKGEKQKLDEYDQYVNRTLAQGKKVPVHATGAMLS